MRPFFSAYQPLIFIVVLTIGLVLPFSVIGQSKKMELEKNKKRIEQEIDYTNKLLEETKKNKKLSLDQLVLLKKRINMREELIKTLNHEIDNLEHQISINDQLIDDLNSDLEHLKEEYAKMIYHAYINRNAYRRLMFIFSANDFNQAYQRLKYFQQYSSFRKEQAKKIEQTQRELENLIESLKVQKAEKVALLQEKEQEKNQLSAEKQQKNQTVKSLNQKEKELLATLKDKEKAARKLQKAIEEIIAEEMRLAAKRAGKSVTSSFALTPAELELSNNFENNKGGLPWPSERGVISGLFGEQPHPVLKGIKTKNNGIDILTDEGSFARAIFSGKVTRVMSIPNHNYVVMVRHGEYLSVYSNLDKVYVKQGDEVETKQNIGKVHTNTEKAKTELHFELWKGKILLNPSVWLAGSRQ